MAARSSKNFLEVSGLVVRQGRAYGHATAGTGRPNLSPSTNEWTYALRVLGWMPPASMSLMSSGDSRERNYLIEEDWCPRLGEPGDRRHGAPRAVVALGVGLPVGQGVAARSRLAPPVPVLKDPHPTPPSPGMHARRESGRPTASGRGG
jgi:hypothetical protein